MATLDSVKTKLQNLLKKANNKTGRSDTDLTSAVDVLIDGFGQGGITPTGTKTITANGTYDVTQYATASVNIPGINARLYDITIGSDKTSAFDLLKNDFLKSLRNDPNAFVMMRCMNPQPSTAMVSFWFTANFVITYNGTNLYNSIVGRASATNGQLNPNTEGLPGDNYNAHLNIDANGRLWSSPNATYPVKAGAYKIIAGTFEML